MYKEHECFEAPKGNPKLWRYVDFTKFVSLLESRELFVPAAKSFFDGDKFEGSIPKRLAELIEDLTRGELEKETNRWFSSARRALCNVTYVSCWHMNAHESEAMWRLYARSTEAVAICTDYETLKAILNDAPRYRQELWMTG